MKNMAEKGEIVVKKWDWGGKNRVIGLLKKRASNQTRKAKWCKMQGSHTKTDKMEDEKI